MAGGTTRSLAWRRLTEAVSRLKAPADRSAAAALTRLPVSIRGAGTTKAGAWALPGCVDKTALIEQCSTRWAECCDMRTTHRCTPWSRAGPLSRGGLVCCGGRRLRPLPSLRQRLPSGGFGPMASPCAGVVKLVDARDSKSRSARSVGSIPTTRTNPFLRDEAQLSPAFSVVRAWPQVAS